MEKVAALSEQERGELFQETAARKGMTPAIVEKDFWVCWVLKKIFADTELSELLMFKGGTSLSKVFHLIERFSEDIDLILDWRVVASDNPLGDRSNTQQDNLNKNINAEAADYISNVLLNKLSLAVSSLCVCTQDTEDFLVVNVHYPAAFSDQYLRPEVRLEIGPLASWLPFDRYKIEPYAAETFPDIFTEAQCEVNAIKAERTFWEKVTILHHEAHRPEGSAVPLRYSRHYYDLFMMAKSNIKEKALADLSILEDVVAFKTRFYRRGWARYELATPGSLRLVPDGRVLGKIEKDYKAMETMVFGEYPDFADMMMGLSALEQEINEIELND